MKTNLNVDRLVSRLADSADHSSKDDNCIRAMMEDLERKLKPYVKFLKTRREVEARVAARKLEALYVRATFLRRLHKKIDWHAPRAAISLELRVAIQPIARMLVNVPAPELRHIAADFMR